MVIWTIPAKDDLRRVYTFIAEDSRYYASEVVEKFVTLTTKLTLFPNQGRVVPELGNPNIRELMIFSYRVIYQHQHDKIYILAIVHMRQKFKKFEA